MRYRFYFGRARGYPIGVRLGESRGKRADRRERPGESVPTVRSAQLFFRQPKDLESESASSSFRSIMNRYISNDQIFEDAHAL